MPPGSRAECCHHRRMSTSAPPPSSSPAGPDAGTGIAVEHDAARSRFVARVDGRESVAEYLRAGDTLRMTHTEVPPAQRGRGIAAALVREAFAHAQREGLKVAPICPYVRSYAEQHPETAALLAR